ncbi:MAG: restriction endonuclease subunit S [Thermoguttaceae bacterium]|nr:restriction endonuclease subunit S [Thermoguttaceae bacterium]
MTRAMKDSGIEWIGKIPVNWVIQKNKALFREVNERCEDGSKYTLLSVSEYTGVTPRSAIIKDGEFETHAETLDGYKICHEDDIVMNIMLAWKRATAASSYDGIISPAYCVFRGKGVETKYYHYLFRTDNCAEMFKRYSTGIIDSRLRLYPDVFLSLKSIVPPLSEQKRIASFLDAECARIDAVIEQTRASIEEYKKLKQAVITRAVTKGLRPDRPMKDSGIEWIGEIPEGWKIAQLKVYATVNSGKEIIEEVDCSDQAVPVFGSGGVFKYTTTSLYVGETVMFGRKGTLGKPIYANGKLWAVDTMYYLTFSHNLIAKFNYYQLVVFDWNKYITQTALPSIVGSEIVSCFFAFPPLFEQLDIAAFLDSECARIDAVVEQKTNLIAELESYKKSLIFEYVTGKKEVL